LFENTLATTDRNESLADVITKLENLFDAFNKQLFSGRLHKPVITSSTKGKRSNALGWCTGKRIWKDNDNDEGYYEINICAEHLNEDIMDICKVLIHEMVHLANLQDGVQDTSRSGTYHNELFKKTAERHGLIVKQVPVKGYTATFLTPKTAAYIESLNLQDFNLRRLAVGQKGQKAKQSSRKLICPLCLTIIRATSRVNIRCGDCSCQFIEQY
jgi:predicted metallopeptidase